MSTSTFTDALQGIKRQSAVELGTKALRDKIRSGSILPGTRLTEVALAEQLEISRSTLRYALDRLSNEGLIVQTPYTGWEVATIAPEDLWELYTLRAGLESTAAGLVCEGMTSDRASALGVAFNALLAACEEGDYAGIAEVDFQLHRRIIQLAEHGRLAEHYTRVEQQIRTFVATTYHFVDAPSSVVAHHEPIVAALLSRNAPIARTLIEEHAISEGQKLHDFLLSGQRSDSQP